MKSRREAAKTSKFQGTKYLGGHSDLLCGVLVVRTEEEWKQVKSVGIDMLNSV